MRNVGIRVNINHNTNHIDAKSDVTYFVKSIGTDGDDEFQMVFEF